jgi:hypothetical protein
MLCRQLGLRPAAGVGKALNRLRRLKCSPGSRNGAGALLRLGHDTPLTLRGAHVLIPLKYSVVLCPSKCRIRPAA